MIKVKRLLCKLAIKGFHPTSQPLTPQHPPNPLLGGGDDVLEARLT